MIHYIPRKKISNKYIVHRIFSNTVFFFGAEKFNKNNLELSEYFVHVLPFDVYQKIQGGICLA